MSNKYIAALSILLTQFALSLMGYSPIIGFVITTFLLVVLELSARDILVLNIQNLFLIAVLLIFEQQSFVEMQFVWVYFYSILFITHVYIIFWTKRIWLFLVEHKNIYLPLLFGGIAIVMGLLIFYSQLRTVTIIREYFGIENRGFITGKYLLPLFLAYFTVGVITILLLKFKKLNFIVQKRKKVIVILLPLIIISIFNNQFIHKTVQMVIISEIHPNRVTLWEDLHIEGNNFGINPEEQGKVFINGKPQRVLRWDQKEIVVVIGPDLQDGLLDLYVVNNAGDVSNVVRLEKVAYQ